MLDMRIDISEGVMTKLEKSIKRKLANIVEDVGLQVYNSIVLQLVKSPYYSGSYISSWTVSKGLPKIGTFNPPPTPWQRNVYGVPQPVLDLGTVGFGQSVYITNAAPHAKIVEYTKTGKDAPAGGWRTATHARNMTVMTYKFKMRP